MFGLVILFLLPVVTSEIFIYHDNIIFNGSYVIVLPYQNYTNYFLDKIIFASNSNNTVQYYVGSPINKYCNGTCLIVNSKSYNASSISNITLNAFDKVSIEISLVVFYDSNSKPLTDDPVIKTNTNDSLNIGSIFLIVSVVFIMLMCVFIFSRRNNDVSLEFIQFKKKIEYSNV